MVVKKVLIITNVPQDYRTSLFNELNDQLILKNITLKVVFAAAGYKRRKQKLDFSEMQFDYAVLKSFKFHFGNIEKTMFTYSGVSKLISGFQPDKIIVTGYSIATLRCWLLSYLKPLNYLIWSGSLQQKGRMDSGMRVWLRKRFLSRACGFVAYGSQAKKYLVQMGAVPEKVYIGLNTVNADYFADQTMQLRSKLEPQAIQHLTYIGYLSPRKNVIKLLEVIKLLSLQRKDFILDLAGDGSDRQKLEEFVKNEKLEDYVRFHGFKQKNELPALLAVSSCFLFQTDFDIWGLVLNEAMAAGVVCISSIKAGATFDLIQDGKNGYAMDFDDTAAVVEKVNFLLDHPEQAKIMGAHAANFIRQEASIKNAADGFMKALLANSDNQS